MMVFKKNRVFVISVGFLWVAILFLLSMNMMAQEKSKEIERVVDAVEVFKRLVNIPEEGIPEALLSKAEAIAVIPGFWKAAWGIGGRHGKGVILVRKTEREWSYPAFISMTGGSVGFQIGVQRADVILVFKNKRSVKNIAEGKFTLGADVGLAAGPVGRKGEASTDIAFKDEIYSYSESKGLFAGISIEGASLSMDNDANALFYRDFNLSVEDILTKDKIEAPSIAEVLRKTIAEFTH
ncbi:MAG: lipid-binding SYLF domain-containing protein [Candidatus Aminicenantes bacterium]|nr:MAG: lipid-binding SYLF domain-containing protein [Candidatus Aminicenantes bacterium]